MITSGIFLHFVYVCISWWVVFGAWSFQNSLFENYVNPNPVLFFRECIWGSWYKSDVTMATSWYCRQHTGTSAPSRGQTSIGASSAHSKSIIQGCSYDGFVQVRLVRPGITYALSRGVIINEQANRYVICVASPRGRTGRFVAKQLSGAMWRRHF